MRRRGRRASLTERRLERGDLGKLRRDAWLSVWTASMPTTSRSRGSRPGTGYRVASGHGQGLPPAPSRSPTASQRCRRGSTRPRGASGCAAAFGSGVPSSLRAARFAAVFSVTLSMAAVLSSEPVVVVMTIPKGAAALHRAVLIHQGSGRGPPGGTSAWQRPAEPEQAG